MGVELTLREKVLLAAAVLWALVLLIVAISYYVLE